MARRADDAYSHGNTRRRRNDATSHPAELVGGEGFLHRPSGRAASLVVLVLDQSGLATAEEQAGAAQQAECLGHLAEHEEAGVEGRVGGRIVGASDFVKHLAMSVAREASPAVRVTFAGFGLLLLAFVILIPVLLFRTYRAEIRTERAVQAIGAQLREEAPHARGVSEPWSAVAGRGHPGPAAERVHFESGVVADRHGARPHGRAAGDTQPLLARHPGNVRASAAPGQARADRRRDMRDVPARRPC